MWLSILATTTMDSTRSIGIELDSQDENGKCVRITVKSGIKRICGPKSGFYVLTWSSYGDRDGRSGACQGGGRCNSVVVVSVVVVVDLVAVGDGDNSGCCCCRAGKWNHSGYSLVCMSENRNRR